MMFLERRVGCFFEREGALENDEKWPRCLTIGHFVEKKSGRGCPRNSYTDPIPSMHPSQAPGVQILAFMRRTCLGRRREPRRKCFP